MNQYDSYSIKEAENELVDKTPIFLITGEREENAVKGGSFYVEAAEFIWEEKRNKGDT